MKKNIFIWILIGTTLSTACTNLEVEEKDSYVLEGGSKSIVASEALNSIYSSDFGGSYGTQENLYALSEASTDELFVPTRGTDWGDNGVWRDLARHAWTPAHTFNRNTWNYLNGAVYKTNQILFETTSKTPEQEAEAKFLRAWFMQQIFDLWRQIPYREADEGPEVNPIVMTGQEAFDFMINDLTQALPNLPTVVAEEIAKQSRASKAGAHFLLAKLYLNKHIYLNSAIAPADMDKVIEHVQAIEADGYALDDGYFSIFAPTKDTETIFWAAARIENRIWGTLHYAQGRETYHGGGGWNGFATTADFYNKFEGPEDSNLPNSGQEERRGYVPTDSLGIGFLIGQQYGPKEVGGSPVALQARSGNGLIFTKEVPTLTGNNDVTGVRILKYHPSISPEGNVQHQIVMRYADAYLMKAEAFLRKDDNATALTLVNDLREIRGATALGSIDLDILLDERGRELYMELVRRSDLIRFGKFNSEFGFNSAVGQEHRNLMPIPDNAITTNPNLKQNPGY